MKTYQATFKLPKLQTTFKIQAVSLKQARDDSAFLMADELKDWYRYVAFNTKAPVTNKVILCPTTANAHNAKGRATSTRKKPAATSSATSAA